MDFVEEIDVQEPEQQQQDPTPKPKKKVLYEAVSKKYDLGTYDEFEKKLQDPAKRKALYDHIGKEYELGTYPEFESKVTDVKKKVGSINFEESSLQAGNAQSNGVGGEEIPTIEMYTTPTGEMIEANPIALSRKFNELNSRTKEVSVPSSGKGGQLLTTTPDEDAIKSAKKLQEDFKDLDLGGIYEETKDIPDEVLQRVGNELLEDRKNNNPLYQRKLANIKWRNDFENKILDDVDKGNIAPDDYNRIRNSIDMLPEFTGSGDFTNQRSAIKSLAQDIQIYGGENKDKILQNFAVEVGKVYGNAYNNNFKKSIEGSPESKYLNEDAQLGLRYLEDVAPEKARQYDRLKVDPKNLEGDALKGYNHLMQTIEETGIGLQQNSVTEELNQLKADATKYGGLSPEQIQKATELEKKQEELTQKQNELDKKYPDRIPNKAMDAVNEVMGKDINWAEYAAVKTGQAFKNTAQGIWEGVSTPFMSDASNTLRELEIMGESLTDEENLKQPDKNMALLSDKMIIQPELQIQVDAIKNDKLLTDEQKRSKLFSLFYNNTDKFGRVPIKGGKFNINPSSILYGLTDLGTTLLPFVAMETVTGGGATAGAARKFVSTFTAAAATSFHDEYASALLSGKSQSEAYKEAMGMTAISSLAMAGANTPSKIKAMLNPKTSAGKLILSMSDDAIQKVLDKGTPKGLKGFGTMLKDRVKAIPEQFKQGVKTGAEFEVAMNLANEAKHQIYDTEIDREQNFKQSLLGIANFGIIGVGAGQIGYKSPTELQKSSLLQFGEKPKEYISVLDELKKEGKVTPAEYDHRKALIESSEKAYATLPKSLDEKQKSEYLYQTVIKNEANKGKSDLPPKQAAEAEKTALVADHTRGLILEAPTDKQLNDRQGILERKLEPKKDAEGKAIELPEKEKLDLQAELEAVNNELENRKSFEKVEMKRRELTPETKNVEPTVVGDVVVDKKSDADIEKRIYELQKKNYDDKITDEEFKELKDLRKEQIRRTESKIPSDGNVVDKPALKDVDIAKKVNNLGEFDNEIRGATNQRRIPTEIKERYLEALKTLAKNKEIDLSHPQAKSYESVYDILETNSKENKPNYTISKHEPIGGGKEIEFVNIGNKYIDPDVKKSTNEALTGMPVSELNNIEAIKSRLEPLIHDRDLEAADGIKDKELNSAIAFLESLLPKEQPSNKQEVVEAKEGFTEGADLNKIYAGLKAKYGDKKAATLYEVANRLVNPNTNTIVEIRGNGVVVKEGGKYILKPFGNTDANSKKWTLYKGLDISDQFANTKEQTKQEVVGPKPEIKNEEAKVTEDTKSTEEGSNAKELVSEDAQPTTGEIKGITQAANEVRRQETNTPEYERNPESFEKWNAEAEQKVKDGYDVEDLMNRIEKGHDPNPVENAIRKIYYATVDAEVAKNPTDKLLAIQKRNATIGDLANSRAGKNLVSLKGEGSPLSSISDFYVAKMDALGAEKLTEEQKAEVKKQYDHVQETNQDAANKIRLLEEENAKLRAEALVKQTKATTKRQTKDYKKEREDLKQSIRDKWNNAGKDILSSDIPYRAQLFAIAPDVAKLMKSYVEEGITEFGEIIKRLHETIKEVEPNATEKDVADILSGKYDTKKETKIDLLQKLKQLKDKKSEEAIKIKARIQSGDFAPAVKQLSWVENPELKKKYPKEYNAALDAIKAKEDARHEFDIALLRDQMARRTRAEKFTDNLSKGLGTVKAITTGIDDSAVAIQTYVSMLVRPRTGVKAFYQHIRQGLSQKKFDRWLSALHTSPDFKEMREMGLDVTEPSSLKEREKEEIFNNRFNGTVKIKGKEYKLLDAPLKPFERAFTTLGNVTRVVGYRTISEKYKREGYTVKDNPELFKSLAKRLNTETGRGEVNEYVDMANKVVTMGIWSPKLMAQKFNILGISDLASLALSNAGTKGYYRQLHPKERMAAIIDVAQFATTVMALSYGFAYAFGGDVDDDPLSSTYMDIKLDNGKSYNFTGGFSGYIRAISQFAAGKKHKNGESKDVNRLETGGRFFRGKTPPVTSAILNLSSGKNFMGQPTTLTDELINLSPISLRGIVGQIQKDGAESFFTQGIPTFFGLNVKNEKDYQDTTGKKEKQSKPKKKEKPNKN